MRTIRLVLCSVLLLDLTGCARKLRLIDPTDVRAGAISFLEDGHTSREAVIAELGAMFAEFEDGRVVTYRLDESFRSVGAHRRSLRGRPARWDRPWGGEQRYSLVLVFDETDTLVDHSLVSVR